MARPGRYVKSSAERKRYQIDWNDWLDVGEGVASVVFTVEDNTLTVPLVVDGEQINPDARGITFLVSGGEADTSYIVIATMTTTADEEQIKTESIHFTIREPS